VFGVGDGIRVLRDRTEVVEFRERPGGRDRSLALVPTMGALHPGHLSLLAEGRALADDVILSIFVNPLQFGPGEDLARYPRTLDRDLELALGAGATAAFIPTQAEMYPRGEPAVWVVPGPLGGALCGPFRPGHFEGVLTVVAKLFGIVRPQVAVFGRKDYQQALLIRRMVEELELPVEIVVSPLIREVDGLAMSSRNSYLSGEEREVALVLSRALLAAEERFLRGEQVSRALLSAAASELDRAGGRIRVQYLELVDSETLAPLEQAHEGALLALAAQIGETRLIDNILLGRGHLDPRTPHLPAHPSAAGGGSHG